MSTHDLLAPAEINIIYDMDLPPITHMEIMDYISSRHFANYDQFDLSADLFKDNEQVIAVISIKNSFEEYKSIDRNISMEGYCNRITKILHSYLIDPVIVEQS